MTPHKNNFGLLRLILASLVIVSHSAEMIDGNRSREALTSLGGAMTLGELAVDGFFIVSGYLILQSFQNSKSVYDYIRKRVMRIYPGFVCCAVIVVGFSPLIGSNLAAWGARDYARGALDILFLNWPDIRGFPELKFHALNGAAWSIVYEFRCYLLVVFLAFAGIYRSKAGLLFVTLLLLVSHAIQWPTYIGPLAKMTGEPQLFIRMASLFCVGGAYYEFRDRVKLNASLAALAIVLLMPCLFVSGVAEPAFAILGGYLIFFFAFGIKSESLARINGRQDISYGTYLYAWPIAGFLIYFFRFSSPLMLLLATLPLSLLAGWISWLAFERWFVRTK